MERFSGWAVAVCAAAIVCAVLRPLFPDSALGRQGRLLLSCLFLCVLLSPLSGGDWSVNVPTFTSEESLDSAALTARMRQQTVAQVNEALLRTVNQSLAVYGWNVQKVVTDMDIAEDGSISMGRILLYVDEDTAKRATAVRQVVEKRLGTEVTVLVWEEPK